MLYFYPQILNELDLRKARNFPILHARWESRILNSNSLLFFKMILIIVIYTSIRMEFVPETPLRTFDLQYKYWISLFRLPIQFQFSDCHYLHLQTLPTRSSKPCKRCRCSRSVPVKIGWSLLKSFKTQEIPVIWKSFTKLIFLILTRVLIQLILVPKTSTSPDEK
jgi:hypothetical protein